jgi:hypothetical protein
MKTHENPNRQPSRVKAIALPAPAEDNMLAHKTTEKPTEEQQPTESRNKEHKHQLLLLGASIAIMGFRGALVWGTLGILSVPLAYSSLLFIR